MQRMVNMFQSMMRDNHVKQNVGGYLVDVRINVHNTRSLGPGDAIGLHAIAFQALKSCQYAAIAAPKI